MKAILFIFILVCFGFQKETPEKTLSKLGVFDGRTPCQELAKMLDEKVPDCTKIKWRLTLFVDSATHKPDSYTLEGFMRQRGTPRKGPWSIIKGSNEDPDATIYRLDASDGKAPLFLLKVDDNVLYFLDSEKKHLVGNKDFSYALNRQEGK
jgi:hypothetical protein